MALIKKPVQQLITHGYHWTAVFVLSALEGLVALVAVVRLPSELENRLFLGLSSSRLLLLALIMVITLLFISLALFTLTPTWRLKWSNQIKPGKRWGSFSIRFSARLCFTLLAHPRYFSWLVSRQRRVSLPCLLPPAVTLVHLGNPGQPASLGCFNLELEISVGLH